MDMGQVTIGVLALVTVGAAITEAARRLRAIRERKRDRVPPEWFRRYDRDRFARRAREGSSR